MSSKPFLCNKTVIVDGVEKICGKNNELEFNKNNRSTCKECLKAAKEKKKDKDNSEVIKNLEMSIFKLNMENRYIKNRFMNYVVKTEKRIASLEEKISKFSS